MCFYLDMMTSSMYCGQGEGLPNTPSGSEDMPCLLDVMSIHLTEMDLYSASRLEGKPGNCPINECITYKGYYLMKDKNQPLRERYFLRTICDPQNGNMSH